MGTNDGARPRADGREFVTVNHSVRFSDDPSCDGEFTSFERVSIHDTASGLAVAGFDIQDDLYGVPNLSPDGQTIAGHWEDSTVCFDNDAALTIWTRDGVELIRGVPEIGDFDWLPDGRLVFEIDGDIAVESERNSLRFRRIALLGDIPGTPRKLDVSPDGQSLVFEMTTGVSGFLVTVDYRESTVWRVGIDGTGLEQIVTSSRTDSENYLNSPIFSPEGDSLIVTENWVSGGVVTFTGFETDTFPIITGTQFAPVTNGAVTQLVPLSELPAALPPQSWSAEAVRPIFTRDDAGALTAARLWPLEGQVWTQKIVAAQTQLGSLPPANGQVNRGLTGNLYRYRDDNEVTELQRLSLSSGVVSTVSVPDAIDLDEFYLFAVSEDESRFVIITYEFLDYTFWAFDSRGENLQSYVLETTDYHLNPESSPHFRPGSNSTVAWAYDDGEFGQSAVIFDFESGSFSTLTNLGYVDDVDWFPNGDLLVVDGSQISRVVQGADGRYTPTPVFSAHTHIDGLTVSPDGQSVVVSSNQQLVLLNLSDGTRRRLTAWTQGADVSPVFSPDGRFISLRKLGSFDFGWPWIVSAEASDVRIFTADSALGAMRVGEGSNLDWRITRSELVWR